MKNSYKGCKTCCSSNVYVLRWVDANDSYVTEDYVPTEDEGEEYCMQCKNYTTIIEIPFDDE